jgi:hypothetical protein
MSKMITVYVVVGFDQNGVRSELAKFFEKKHAEDFMVGRRLRPISQAAWKDVGLEVREERLEDQHYAHGGKVGGP